MVYSCRKQFASAAALLSWHRIFHLPIGLLSLHGRGEIRAETNQRQLAGRIKHERRRLAHAPLGAGFKKWLVAAKLGDAPPRCLPSPKNHKTTVLLTRHRTCVVQLKLYMHLQITVGEICH